jgi:hypothetical protein
MNVGLTTPFSPESYFKSVWNMLRIWLVGALWRNVEL